MAFVWGINPYGVLDVPGFLRNNEIIAELPIGYDDDTGWTISVFVAFSPMAGGDLEHVFCVVSANPETTERDEFWSGEDTKNLFSISDREGVLDTVCNVTFWLLKQFRPTPVYYSTHDANLPDKAIQKYHVLGMVYDKAGYKLRQLPPHHGRLGWRADL